MKGPQSVRVCQRSGHFSNDLSAKVLEQASDQPRKNGSRWIFTAQLGSGLITALKEENVEISMHDE